jgi:hypothetical protein
MRGHGLRAHQLAHLVQHRLPVLVPGLARRAQPAALHLPGTCGSVALPPTKAPAKSVPPEMELDPDRAGPSTLRAARPDPVVAGLGQRRAGGAHGAQRRQVGLAHQAAHRPSGNSAKKAAPAPKKVARASPAKRHSVPQSGAAEGQPGLPSKMQQVVPPSSRSTWPFHMIQPVVLYQWKRSPVLGTRLGPRSLCRRAACSASSRMPPWPCTMGLGRPVVPLE